MTNWETLLTHLAALGVWPALPATGYWLLVRHRKGIFADELPRLTMFALTVAGGIVVWSPLLLGTAVLRVYRADLLGLVGWGIAAAVFWHSWRQENRLALKKVASPELWDWVLVLGLSFAAIEYCAFVTKSILGGRDQGLYASYGMYIARYGRLDVLYPWPEEAQAIVAKAFVGFLGLIPTQPTMTMYFPPQFSLWLAQAFSSLGDVGLFRLNALFALLSLCIFYGYCRAVCLKPYAVVATIFLALNPSELWLARITLSEILTQLLLWTGALLLLHAFRRHDPFLARWAGIFWGSAAFVRIDSFVIVPLLFVAHFFFKIVQKPEERQRISLWGPLYQTALPLFLLAVVYYRYLSAPYFSLLFSELRLIGVLTFAVGLVALGTRGHVQNFFYQLVTHRLALWLTGSIVLLLAAYAYWIRPYHGPFAIMMNWPEGHFLQGTRDYREESFVNLARYLSPPILWAAVVGWILSLKRHIREGKAGEWFLGIIVAGVAVLYLWKPSVAPDHYWAIRRFVPIVIPGFLLFAAFGLQWAIAQVPQKWRSLSATALLVWLAFFTLWASAPLLLFQEDSGYFTQLKRLAEKLPRDAVVFASGSSNWVTPLYLSLDRHIVPINLKDQRGQEAIRLWAARQAKLGRPVYLLYQGQIDFSQPELLAQLFGVDLVCLHHQGPIDSYQRVVTKEVETFLIRPFLEGTTKPLPRRRTAQQFHVSLYKITEFATQMNYRNTLFGAKPVSGVQESGFHEQEWVQNQPFRWTIGTAKVVVPPEGQRAPKALSLELESPRPQGTQLEVRVNGRKLFHEWIPAGAWSRVLPLPSLLNEPLTIELVSGTFRPCEIIPGAQDCRTLGVAVKAIRLLDSMESLTCAPSMREATSS